MEKLNIEELKSINGGENEEYYEMGENAGKEVGKWVRWWLTLAGLRSLA